MTDQSRLTKACVDDNVEKGLSKEAYVELAVIVVAVFSIDGFHRLLGLDLKALPLPEPDEPSHYRPAQATEATGFVPMIPRDGAVGPEVSRQTETAYNRALFLNCLADDHCSPR